MQLVYVQDAVRGDFGEVAELIESHGGKVYLEDVDQLVPLASSPIAKYASTKLLYEVILCLEHAAMIGMPLITERHDGLKSEQGQLHVLHQPVQLLKQ